MWKNLVDTFFGELFVDGGIISVLLSQVSKMMDPDYVTFH